MPQEHSVLLIRSCELLAIMHFFVLAVDVGQVAARGALCPRAVRGLRLFCLLESWVMPTQINQPVYVRKARWLYASESSVLVLTDALLVAESACWQPMDE